MKSLKMLLPSIAALLLAGQVIANPCPPGNPPTNCAPPTGAILDFNGQAIPHQYTHYDVTFIATATSTNISFAFREDPAFLYLDDVSVLLNNAGANLLTNGGFESGVVGNNAPVGWTYLNTFGATFAGVVQNFTGGANSGSNFYYDGAVQAYDGITQAIATTVGQSYTIGFSLKDDGPYSTFSRVSTNGNVTGTGGNGVDALVYAGRVPSLVPEPASLALLGLGLAGMGFVRRRKAG